MLKLWACVGAASGIGYLSLIGAANYSLKKSIAAGAFWSDRRKMMIVDGRWARHGLLYQTVGTEPDNIWKVKAVGGRSWGAMWFEGDRYTTASSDIALEYMSTGGELIPHNELVFDYRSAEWASVLAGRDCVLYERLDGRRICYTVVTSPITVIISSTSQMTSEDKIVDLAVDMTRAEFNAKLYDKYRDRLCAADVKLMLLAFVVGSIIVATLSSERPSEKSRRE